MPNPDTQGSTTPTGPTQPTPGEIRHDHSAEHQRFPYVVRPPDPDHRCGIRRDGVRAQAGEGAQARRGGAAAHQPHCAPAVSATASARGLRRAHPAVRGGAAAQDAAAHPDRAGRRDRRGPAGEGRRCTEDKRRGQRRALRLPGAHAGQRDAPVRHPGPGQVRGRREDARRGGLDPRPRDHTAGPGGGQLRPRRARGAAAVRGGRRRLRGHGDGRVSAAAHDRRGQALSRARPGAHQVAPGRCGAQAHAGAGRSARRQGDGHP